MERIVNGRDPVGSSSLNPNLGIRNNLSVTYPHFISLLRFEHRRRGVICDLGLQLNFSVDSTIDILWDNKF